MRVNSDEWRYKWEGKACVEAVPTCSKLTCMHIVVMYKYTKYVCSPFHMPDIKIVYIIFYTCTHTHCSCYRCLNWLEINLFSRFSSSLTLLQCRSRVNKFFFIYLTFSLFFDILKTHINKTINNKHNLLMTIYWIHKFENKCYFDFL